MYTGCHCPVTAGQKGGGGGWEMDIRDPPWAQANFPPPLFTLQHCIIHVLFYSLLQIDIRRCFYCPQKVVSLVPLVLLSPTDQTLLRANYPDVGRGAVCDLRLRSVCLSSFFSGRSSGASSSSPRSVYSGLQVPLYSCGSLCLYSFPIELTIPRQVML